MQQATVLAVRASLKSDDACSIDFQFADPCFTWVFKGQRVHWFCVNKHDDTYVLVYPLHPKSLIVKPWAWKYPTARDIIMAANLKIVEELSYFDWSKRASILG